MKNSLSPRAAPLLHWQPHLCCCTAAPASPSSWSPLTLLSCWPLTLGSGKITMMGHPDPAWEGSRPRSGKLSSRSDCRACWRCWRPAPPWDSRAAWCRPWCQTRLATPDMIGGQRGASLAIIIFLLYLTLGTPLAWWAAPAPLFAAVVLYALCNKPGEQGWPPVRGDGSRGLRADERPRPVRHVHPVPGAPHQPLSVEHGNFVGQGYGTLLPVSLLPCSSVPGTVCLSCSLGVPPLGPVTASTLGVNVNRVQLGAGPRPSSSQPLAPPSAAPGLRLAMAAPSLPPGSGQDRIVPLWIAAWRRPDRRRHPGVGAGQPHEVATGIAAAFSAACCCSSSCSKDRQKAD